MSYADDVFIKMCQDILENGTSTEGEKVRPVWEDGTPASRSCFIETTAIVKLPPKFVLPPHTVIH